MSTFKFTPKSEDELSELLAEGDAGFEIVDAAIRDSQNTGKPMLVLKLKVYDSKGEEGLVTDWIVLDETSKFSMRKLKHLCDCLNLQKIWECGEIDPDCFKGSGGKLRLGAQKNQLDKSGNPVRDRNVVWDYLIQKEPQVQSPPLKDDDVPFFK